MADPLPKVPLTRTEKLLVGLCAALIAFAVYVLTLAPSVTGEDSGELIAAAFTLGIPHPPGYPIWCMLAHLFTWLPGDSVAWKVNLSSAVFGAATVAVVAWLLAHVTNAPWTAFFGSLLLAFSSEFWEQAIIAEVYTLNALFIALCVVWLLKWHETRRDRYLWCFAVTYGLSLGNHNTMHLLAPVFGLFVLVTDWGAPDRLRRYLALSCLVLLIAFTLQLYIPLRSLANPPVDWGNPETLRGWWDHFTRAQYAFMLEQYPRGWERLGRQLSAMAGLLFRQWGALLVPLVLFVFLLKALFQKGNRPLKFLLIAIFVAVLMGFTFIQNFNLDKEWRWVMTAFLLPCNMAVVVLATIGIQHAAIRMKRPVANGPGALAFFAFWTLFSTGETLAWRDDMTVPRYIDEIAAEMPPNAIFVPHADHASFPFLYYQVVEGRYPDVLLARKYGYLDTAALSEVVPGLVEKYGFRPTRRLEPEILRAVHAATDRPLVFTQGSAGLLRGAVHQQGLTWTTGAPVPVAPDSYAPDRRSYMVAGNTFRPGDYTEQLIAAERCFAAAESWLESGDPNKAAEQIRTAIEYYGEDPNLLTNAGVLFARHGEFAKARYFWKKALAQDPLFQPAINNLAKLDEKTRGED